MVVFALEQLIAFERVAREGSFSRAALALGIGQPAISSRIQALEGALGGSLFRRGRRIAITTLGESFLPYVRRALDVLSEGVETARLAQEGRRGRITLGVLNSLAAAVVGPALARYVRAYPEVDCLVKAGDHESVLTWLLDGIVELALIAWPCPPALDSDLHALFSLREPVVLVAHRRHPLAKLKRIARSDLVRLGRPLYRLRWWQTHDPGIVALAERTGQSLDLPMETARHLVTRGLGLGFFPRAAVADELERGALVELAVRDLPPITRETALVRRLRAAPLSPAATRLVDLLRVQARSLNLLR
jgi:LysR family transcriptional regulator, low CO2-responsive transcriptional regulator